MGSTEEIRDLIDKIVSYMVAMNQEELVNLFKNEHYGIGTGEDESHRTIEDVKEHWELSFTLDELHMDNLLIHNIKVVEDVAWCFFNADSKWVKNEEVVYEGKLRLSMVLEKEDGLWLISQVHASVPQIGVDEVTKMPTRNAMKNKIDELISDFELYPTYDTKGKVIKEYLEKAREIAVNLSI